MWEMHEHEHLLCTSIRHYIQFFLLQLVIHFHKAGRSLIIFGTSTPPLNSSNKVLASLGGKRKHKIRDTNGQAHCQQKPHVALVKLKQPPAVSDKTIFFTYMRLLTLLQGFQKNYFFCNKETHKILQEPTKTQLYSVYRREHRPLCAG